MRKREMILGLTAIALAVCIYLALRGADNKGSAGNEPSQWILVFVGIITCAVIAWQAVATEESAKAALLNVKALVHSERPWLIVQIEEIRGGSPAMTLFQLHAYNHGKSPAYVISCSKLTIIWLENPSAELPAKPVYEVQDWDKNLLLPKHKITIGSKIDPWMDEAMQKVPTQPQRQLVIYGTIGYTDGTTDTIHHTAFCYRRKRDKLSDMGGHLVLCGPSAYNKHT